MVLTIPRVPNVIEGQVGHLHLPLGGIVATGELRPQAGGTCGDPRRVSTDRHHDGRDRDLRTSAPAGATEPPLGAGAVVDARLERPFGRSPHHADGPVGPSPGLRPQQPRPDDWPSIAAVAGALTAPRNNLPPGGGPARDVDPQHRADHSRPVRGLDGAIGATPGSSRLRPSTRLPTVPIRLTSSTTRSVPSLPRPSVSRRRAWACPRDFLARGSRGRMSLLKCVDHQRAALDTLAESEPFDRYRQAAISLLDRREGQGGLRRRRRRAESARPLRPPCVRLVVAHGPPTGRGGGEPRSGQPGQQRDLGHARQHVPSPEGQALPAHRPGPLCAARRPA